MSTQQVSSRLRIAYITILNPLDKKSNSGLLYYVGRAMQQYCGDVTYITANGFPRPSLRDKVRAKISRMVFKKQYLHNVSLATARKLSALATQKLAGQTFDVIVSMGGGVDLTYLEPDIPLILIGDATFAQLINYYPYYSHLSGQTVREMHAFEQQVFSKVSSVIMSSEWAARSVKQAFAVDPERVHVVPFGANIDTFPAKENIVRRKPSSKCRLLFVGVEWERKGGDIAFKTLLKLHEMGIKAELTVCGCVPPRGVTHASLRVIPFLSKNDEQQRQELEKLYMMADFFILPTRAEAFGLVLAEANAFGLPVITSETGGVTAVIHDGENGYVLPLEARGEAFATIIADLYRDEDRYHQLVLSSRAAFEERLNWDVWGKAVNAILQEITVLQLHR